MLLSRRVLSIVFLLNVLLLCLSSVSARPGRLYTPTPAVTSALIISFKDVLSLERAERLCRGERVDWSIPDFENAPEKWIAGEFTAEEVEILERCIPDGIVYVENDALVMKAEGPMLSGLDALPTVLREEMFPSVHLRRHLLQSGSDQRRRRAKPDLAEIVGNRGEKSQDVHVALWNLDRIDQRDLPLDKMFHYGTNTTVGTGEGVYVYILDSGVLTTHREFDTWSGTGTRAAYGYDFVDDDAIAEDCDGHGTHVASTVIGRTVGIAKQAEVIAVRVLDCEGSGNISTTVAGLDWVTANYKTPAVVALSLGVSIGRWSQSLEDSVKTLINDHGIPVVVASGNSGVDSCFIAPANVPETITVAASDLDSKFGETKDTDQESIYRWSNTGACVDLFAPGVDIYGACGGVSRCDEVTDDAYTWASGTSMAVPHVAGVVAAYLGDFPTMLPSELKDELVAKSTEDKIFSEHLRPDTPNRLLYSHGMESIIVATEGP